MLGHLHGTELLMLEEIAAGPPPDWRFAARWEERMRDWAAACTGLLVSSGGEADRSAAILGVPRERFTVAPNGLTRPPSTLPQPAPADRRPGSRTGAGISSSARAAGAPAARPAGYGDEHLASFRDGVVLLCVGRFTAVKRVSLLIEAHAGAAAGLARPAPLVLLGGHLGEWEGEHPLETIARVGARDVFLAGWHAHDALPAFFHASDADVLASVREQFGLALVEGMACGLPGIAVDRDGPAEIVTDGETGWLVPPDDAPARADAIAAAVGDDAERARRGAAARLAMRERYSWDGVARTVAGALDTAAARSSRVPV